MEANKINQDKTNVSGTNRPSGASSYFRTQRINDLSQAPATSSAVGLPQSDKS
jgi:hypothetical protein